VPHIRARLSFLARDYDSPAAVALTEQVQQEYVERYGGPDSAPIAAAEFAPPGGVFLVGYVDDEPVAMGGLRPLAPGTVELKRMYVRPEHRGLGLSRELLAALETAAISLGARRIVLETGRPQPEALGLYRTSGYDEIPGYGYYATSPLSVCLAKDLTGLSE
jgi:GNAT superfamily N-acetyltransferase